MTGLLRIRPATPEDVAAVVTLVRTADLPVDGVDSVLVPSLGVAEAGERIVGCAAVETCGRVGLLRSVVVALEARGRGVGARLVEDRLAWADAAGLDALYLLTTTAATFFRRQGFATVERAALPAAIRATSEFTTLCPDTAVAMVRSVRHASHKSLDTFGQRGDRS